MKLFYSVLFLIAIINGACNHTGGGLDVLTPKPDRKPEVFMPGIISSDSLDFNAAFSPDERTCYFTRTVQGKWQIFQTVFEGGAWQKPTRAPFSEQQYSQADPFVTPDGSVYYISNRPRDNADTIPDFDIWVVKVLPGGEWSAPENLAVVNSDSTEYYVSLAANGSLYFASTRPGGFGGLDIYRSAQVNGVYQEPENVGASINTKDDEHDPLIFGNEDQLVFTAVNRPDGYGEADLYYSFREGLVWSGATNMGQLFNTPTYEYCSNFSPGGKYFFYSSEYDVKWISAEVIDSLVSRRPQEQK